jgi:hypothetical protein
MSTHMLWGIYFAYFQSRLWNRILFWGSDGETIQVFWLQRKMIGVVTGEHKRESCRRIFRKFRILTLTSLYILGVLCFTKCTMEI